MTQFEFCKTILGVKDDFDAMDVVLDHWFVHANSIARSHGYVCANCRFLKVINDPYCECVKRLSSTCQDSICKHFDRLG